MPDPRETVWHFDDLGFFLGAILPSYLVAGLLTTAIPGVGPRRLAYQSLLFVFLLSVLYVLARVRYGVSFGKAVGWHTKFRGAWYCIFGAPVLSITIAILGALIHPPLVPNAVDTLTAEGVSLPVIALFAVIFGPTFEELVFRGFLQPLFEKATGRWRGLIVASLLFALLHAAQADWQWQYPAQMFVAGMAFGLVRQWTDSTAAAFLLHMGFNLVPFASTILTRQ
jgi:membrane protease YdiL (CAAX protease family)